MPRKPRYYLTGRDKDLLNVLVHDLATEIDLHYDDEDLHAVSGSFSILKHGLALLERAGCRIHPDIRAVIARYDKARQ
jgi:hypothetical protein